MKRKALLIWLRLLARCGHSRSKRRYSAYNRKPRVVERVAQADADAVVNPADAVASPDNVGSLTTRVGNG